MTQVEPAVASGPGPLVPLAEAVEGFVGLGAWLEREIGGHARAVAERLDRGGYTPDFAARDAARSVALAVAASFRVANEFFEAALVVARPPTPNKVTVQIELDKSYDVPCKLSLAKQLRSPFVPPGFIPDEQVTFDPQPLPVGRTEFSVIVDATRIPGAPYRGRVAVTPDGGPAKLTVVDIAIRVR